MRQKNQKGLVGLVDTGDHVRLPCRPRITVLEYGDFECPNCKQAVAAVGILLRRFSNQVEFVYRHFPLQEVHPHALAAAEAAECAGAQGKFWEMHDLLFANQSRLERAHLLGYAEELRLDVARFSTELDGHVHVPRVRKDMDSGARSGVRSTPGFFVDGAIEDTSFGLHALLEATEMALRSKELIYRGARPVDGIASQ